MAPHSTLDPTVLRRDEGEPHSRPNETRLRSVLAPHRLHPSSSTLPPIIQQGNRNSQESYSFCRVRVPIHESASPSPPPSPQVRVRESWLIEDRWWAQRPLRRRYWEVVTACGRDVVVFHELEEGGWFAQR